MSLHDDKKDVLFVISVAAQLAGMHPQTLRQYDRLGLVSPTRTRGRGRRYSHEDIQRLRNVQRLSQEEGINLAGIRRILDLERRVRELEDERDNLKEKTAQFELRATRVFGASADGKITAYRRGSRLRSNENAQADQITGLVPLSRNRSIVLWSSQIDQ